VINNFKEEKNKFLSNFYITSIPFYFAGYTWDCSEIPYQAMKATNESDFLLIANSKTPGESKKLGKKINISKNFNLYKVEIMWTILLAKFSLPKEKNMLISTEENILIEGNYWHDNFWGDCFCPKCKEIEGINTLGKLLMELRNELK